MAADVPPSDADATDIAPRPGSIVWRYAGDVRLLATGGYALLLQVSHPTIGAGVTEHSNFKADPWGRLLRTLDYSYSMVYGGPEVAAWSGRRVWEMHKRIDGRRPDGEQYHALEPEAYAWVHATLAESIVTGHERFGRSMPADDVECFYADWRRMGRLVGVSQRELPEGWASFREYFDHMIAERLEDTEAVQDVLASLADPARPPVPLMNQVVWGAARLPLARLASLGTIGLLPSVLRERFGIAWTRLQDLELRALATTARTATPALRGPLQNIGPAYLRWRGITSPRPPDLDTRACATAA